jgi:putative metallopeptidase
MARHLDNDTADDDERKDGKVQQLRPGQKAKGKEEPRPPAEAPRTWPAPEVASIANALIRSARPHMGALRSLRIDYVFSNAEREGEMDLATAQRFNRTYSYLSAGKEPPTFLLRISKPQWDRVPDDLKEQAVYHYLLRFGTDTNARPRIVRPDLVGFLAEAEQFKDAGERWNQGFKRAIQLGLFDGVASAELAAT